MMYLRALINLVTNTKLWRKIMSRDKYFIKDNEKNNEEIFSPSGKYKLVITEYTTKPGCWNYSRGRVYHKDSDECIADVKRNYHRFPYSWIESHANGHDYLICGADYQGQTIIELDTGKRVDYVPKSAQQGAGFCWVAHNPSPDGQLLAVEGCFWAAPYEVVIYDFSNPMEAPWLELARDSDNEDFIEWIDNNSCKIGRSYEWSKKYNKREHELSDDELDDMDKLETTEGYAKVWEVRTDSIIWTRPTSFQSALNYINDYFAWRKKQGYDKYISEDAVDMAQRLVARLTEDELRQFASMPEKDLLDWGIEALKKKE